MIRRSYTANRVDKDGVVRGCIVVEAVSLFAQPCKVLELIKEEAAKHFPDDRLIDFRRVK